jgi:hypothetical protein
LSKTTSQLIVIFERDLKAKASTKMQLYSIEKPGSDLMELRIPYSQGDGE